MGLQIWGKGADQNVGPFWPSGPVWSNFIKFYVFSTQSLIGLRPRLQFFKHVGQVPYSRGFKFGEKGPIKILVHFGRQVRYGRISSNFTSFQHRA